MAEDEGPYLVMAAFCTHIMPLGHGLYSVPDMQFNVTIPAGARLTDMGVEEKFPRAFWLLFAGGRQLVTAQLRLDMHYPSGRILELFDDPQSAGGAQRITTAAIALTNMDWEPGSHWAVVRLNGREATRVPLHVQLEQPGAHRGQLPM